MVRKLLLWCGIGASVLYILMNIFIPPLYEGYNSASQTVSELSAIGAPTRKLWVLLGIFYSLLILAFGWGVWLTAGKSRPLKIAGIVLVLSGFVGMFWPPMHQREVIAAGGGSVTDTLHIVWTFIIVPAMMLTIGFSAFAFGKSFRWYSIITIVVLFTAGLMTGIQSPRMEAGLPTPSIGIWERISIGVYYIWLMIFAALLLLTLKARAEAAAEGYRHNAARKKTLVKEIPRSAD